MYTTMCATSAQCVSTFCGSQLFFDKQKTRLGRSKTKFLNTQGMLILPLFDALIYTVLFFSDLVVIVNLCIQLQPYDA